MEILCEILEFITEVFADDVSAIADDFLEKKRKTKNWRAISVCILIFLVSIAAASLWGGLFLLLRYENDFILCFSILIIFLAVCGIVKVIRFWKNKKKDG